MWSKKYEKCVVCGTIDVRHKGRGMCTNCWVKNWQKINYQKTREINNKATKRYRKQNLEKCRLWKKKWNNTHPESHKNSQKKYYRLNRKKCRGYTIKYKYGITIDEYDAILKRQSSKCAICGSKDSHGKGGLRIDHCHKSKKIRGLLCDKCNLALGLFKDKASNLLTAANYLLTNQ